MMLLNRIQPILKSIQNAFCDGLFSSMTVLPAGDFPQDVDHDNPVGTLPG